MHEYRKPLMVLGVLLGNRTQVRRLHSAVRFTKYCAFVGDIKKLIIINVVLDTLWPINHIGTPSFKIWSWPIDYLKSLGGGALARPPLHCVYKPMMEAIVVSSIDAGSPDSTMHSLTETDLTVRIIV